MRPIPLTHEEVLRLRADGDATVVYVDGRYFDTEDLWTCCNCGAYTPDPDVLNACGLCGPCATYAAEEEVHERALHNWYIQNIL